MGRTRSKKYIIEDKNRSSIKMYCEYCGHTNTIPAFVDKKICSYCHRMIKNKTQAYFTKKMIDMLKEKGDSNKKDSV